MRWSFVVLFTLWVITIIVIVTRTVLIFLEGFSNVDHPLEEYVNQPVSVLLKLMVGNWILLMFCACVLASLVMIARGCRYWYLLWLLTDVIVFIITGELIHVCLLTLVLIFLSFNYEGEHGGFHPARESMPTTTRRMVWRSDYPIQASWAIARRFKRNLNVIGLDSMGKWVPHHPEWAFVRLFECKEESNPLWASRAYGKLLDVLERMKKSIVPAGKVVDLCAGRGGWSQLMAEYDSVTSVDYYSLDREGQKFSVYESARGFGKINVHYGDIGKVEPYETDWLLFDGGEQSKDCQKEGDDFLHLFRKVMPWIPYTKHFVLKILTPWHAEIQDMLVKIQQTTGRGFLIRLDRSRNSNLEVYFCSLPFVEDPKLTIPRIIEGQESKVRRARAEFKYLSDKEKKDWARPDFVIKKIGMGVNPSPAVLGYENLKHKGISAPELEPYNIAPTLDKLEKVFGEIKPPDVRARNKCAKEIGVIPGVASRGSSGTVVNSFVADAVGPLGKCLPGFSNWRVTDTTPRGVEEVFLRKVDTAPKENHQYFPELEEAYKALSDFIREDGTRLEHLCDDEIRTNLTRDSSMGEPNFSKYTNVGEYFDSGDWIADTEDVKTKFAEGNPDLIAFNIIGKSEVKFTNTFLPKGSRFVWFYPAAVRIHEMRTVGGMNHIVRKFPFSVSGLPLYDYGDFMWNLWSPDYYAITEDVAGWDTRISVGIFRLENAFCQSLTDDPVHKSEIHQLYRAWAYPLYFFRRPGSKGTEISINQAQGGKASGIQLTYAMNTITNAALIYTRICKALKVPKEGMRAWILDHLKNFREKPIKMVISGDDSVVMGDMKSMVAYQGKFSVHNVTGFIRKDIGLNQKSELICDFESISFCSHRFCRVGYRDRKRGIQIYKRMPFRTESEILAKAMIMKTKRSLQLDKLAVEGWARIQGLNLLVNYHHLSNVRLVGLALMDITRENLSFEGLVRTGNIRQEPWIRPGDLMDIINDCLFGESSAYPREGFRVEAFRDLGYASLFIRQQAFQRELSIKARASWRDNHLLRVVQSYLSKRECRSKWLSQMVVIERRMEKNSISPMPEEYVDKGALGYWRVFERSMNPDSLID